jgi:hypothetical protein
MKPRKLNPGESLAEINPELAKQWHLTKNGDLTPYNVTPGSQKKVRWKCHKGDDHEWEACIVDRKNGNGCPICSNRKVVDSNSLTSLNPELAKQWHPTKNVKLTPSDVVPGSAKKAWWVCHEGDDHVWKTSIVGRSRGSGCPFCSGHKTSKSNSLAFLNPKIAKEWHPTKNGKLTPSDVTSSSGKKVWWQCPKGNDHEWQAIMSNRNKGIGCPICSNQKLAKSNSLAASNPDLAKEWHPNKNKDLTPFDVLPSTNKKIWWQCSKNSKHEWLAKLNNRSNGKGCPICCNQKLVRYNSLGSVNPILAKEWHLTKNGKLTPYDVAPGTDRKVWWKCPKGDDHVWRATVNHRSSGTSCPKCNPVWSIPELRIISELKPIFPSIQHRAILQGFEVDVYIPELKVGIEYDGVYWHQDKHEKDQKKNLSLTSSILLIRIREKDLPLLSPNDISIKKRSISVSTIKKILIIILEQRNIASPGILTKIQKYLKTKDWTASKQFNKLYSERNLVKFEKSLIYLFPDISKEWHPTKNDLLLPEYFSPGSGRKVWWLGKCEHEWQDSINHRTSGRDCPQCRYKKASQTRRRKRMSPGQLTFNFI